MVVLEAKILCSCRGRCSPEQRKGGTSRSCPCLTAGQSCSTLCFCRRSLSKNLQGAVIILIGFLERCVVRFRLLMHSFRDQDMRASFSVTKHRNQHLVGPSQPVLRVPSGTGKSMSAASKYFLFVIRPRDQGLRAEEDVNPELHPENSVNSSCQTS